MLVLRRSQGGAWLGELGRGSREVIGILECANLRHLLCKTVKLTINYMDLFLAISLTC